ncbi:MAG: Gfo/Idh/MocA family oxidoreductase [Acidobacteriia bacterium]|nr:Gfo/Idh/MocA family oxidoreductase [Terriglobia bacterium]
MQRKLLWGMVGGGQDSQIGSAHRIGAGLDGFFEFAAGALDIVPERGREFAVLHGISPERAYGDWREMLERERGLPPGERLDLVTVATPNSTHFEIAQAFMREGFHVLCEKPLTTTVDDAEKLVLTALERDRILAVNYGYTGYPMVRQARAMVAAGGLGAIRVVVAEFAHGSHADAADADNPRVRWRYDPAQAGVSSVLADTGLHALHMACYVIGRRVAKVAADFASCVDGRVLEDDAMATLRFTGGEVGRLWASAVAVGQIHGLTLRVFGERGGLRWSQEQPNQLAWTPLGQSTQILERGAAGLAPEANRASRITVGHAEGMLPAFANIYADLAGEIRRRATARDAPPVNVAYPTGEDGLHTLAVVHAAAESARRGGSWIDLGTQHPAT